MCSYGKAEHWAHLPPIRFPCCHQVWDICRKPRDSESPTSASYSRGSLFLGGRLFCQQQSACGTSAHPLSTRIFHMPVLKWKHWQSYFESKTTRCCQGFCQGGVGSALMCLASVSEAELVSWCRNPHSILQNRNLFIGCHWCSQNPHCLSTLGNGKWRSAQSLPFLHG